MKKLLLWLLMALWFSVQAQTPQLVSVSVINEEGHVELRWQQPDGIVADSCIILRQDDLGTLKGIDTIPNNLAFIWTDTTTNPYITRYLYQIIGRTNGQNFPDSNYLQPVFQYGTLYLGCENKNMISWIEYSVDSLNIIDRYLIQYKIGEDFWMNADIVNSQDVISGKVNNNKYNPEFKHKINKYSYLHAIPTNNQTYTYRITPLISGVDTIYSNISYTPTPAYTQPEAPVLQNVTVANDQTIEATISIATPLLATEVSLLRTGSQAPAETNTLVFPVQTTSLFRDETAKTDEQSYIYTAGLKDTCGYLVEGVETHRTIHLKADRLNNTSIQLIWNSYEGWTVTEQEVWRYQGGDSTSLANILPGSEYLTDDLSLSTSQEAVIQYRVKAIGSTPVQVSFSNKVEVVLDFTPKLPNAFNPYSSIAENSTFKPVQEVYNSDGYSFQVFNRWGELIWESSSPSEGWDGRVGGQLMPKGTYVYLLKYLDVNSHLQHLRGSFVLIY